MPCQAKAKASNGRAPIGRARLQRGNAKAHRVRAVAKQMLKVKEPMATK